MNKKIFKFSLVLCASVLMAISCNKKETTNPELPSIGKLTAQAGSILSLKTTGADGTEKSGAITVSGFSDGFKKDAKATTDIKYTIKKVEVKGVGATAGAAQTMQETEVEKVQKAIKDGAFLIVNSTANKFDELQVAFASKSTDQTTADKNAQAIATAIGDGKTATIALTVEASPAGKTEGKYTATTFEVRFGIKVATGN